MRWGHNTRYILISVMSGEMSKVKYHYNFNNYVNFYYLIYPFYRYLIFS